MEARKRFAALAELPDSRLPLDEAAFLIAAHATPGLDVSFYLSRLDDLAATCRAPTLDGLVAHLFGSGRFRGNQDDYYDPRNSFLSDVVDRGLGIPITLSVLAMEVGRRVGVPLAGAGLPGHFLLRDKVDPSVFVDAFNGGRLLDLRGCAELHRRLAGPDAQFDPGWLEPVSRWSIVARMLANLKAIYTQRGDRRSLRWVLALRCLVPGLAQGDQEELVRLMAPYN
jgi:regulator of sirC expression with transglutaminase-like and TPR domain